VDRVVTGHGAYIPVEMLLDLDWLRLADYEAWRRGDLPGLEAALPADVASTVRLLK
jgi:hypothetical protein